MLRRLSSYFFRGLLIAAPVGLTAWVLYRLVVVIDGWITPVHEWIEGKLGRELPTFPGFGLAASLALVTLLGFLASNFVAQGLLRLFESMLGRLPLVRWIYNAIKDLLDAFVGEQKRFDRPVLVLLYAGCEGKVLGYVTRQSLGSLGLEDHVAVYFPQSYNFAGQVLVVPRDNVVPLQVDPGDLMAFIVSGGVALGKGDK